MQPKGSGHGQDGQAEADTPEPIHSFWPISPNCVSLAIDDFVVIVRLGLSAQGFLRGRFITCFVADNSIGKIRQAPAWSETQCVQLLAQRQRKGR